MKKREMFLISALAFSTGVVFGFLLSPIKSGIGNNAGNNIHNYYIEKDPKDN